MQRAFVLRLFKSTNVVATTLPPNKQRVKINFLYQEVVGVLTFTTLVAFKNRLESGQKVCYSASIIVDHVTS